jgi:hypothetical protein
MSVSRIIGAFLLDHALYNIALLTRRAAHSASRRERSTIEVAPANSEGWASSIKTFNFAQNSALSRDRFTAKFQARRGRAQRDRAPVSATAIILDLFLIPALSFSLFLQGLQLFHYTYYFYYYMTFALWVILDTWRPKGFIFALLPRQRAPLLSPHARVILCDVMCPFCLV